MKAYDRNQDYCGPGKSWLTRLISNTPWGANINMCCYAHDVAYEAGGTGKDRLAADQRFRECIMNRFSRQRWTPKFIGRMVAGVYYNAVRIAGSPSFTYKDAPNTVSIAGENKESDLESGSNNPVVG